MASYRSTLRALNPALYLRAGEMSGTSAKDESANAHVGTYNGTVTLAQTGLLASDPNTCVDLDGASGNISVPDHASLDLGDTFTLIWWVNLDTFASTQYLGTKGANAYGVYVFTDGKPTLEKTGVGNIVSSTTALVTGKTAMVAVTKSGAASAKIYIDANDVSGAVTDRTCSDNSAVYRIGSNNAAGANFLNGRVDEIAVFPTALTQEQIRTLYNKGVIGLPKFDVVIDGEGYMMALQEEARAAYGYTPTFVPRSDVAGDYGDNKQDFWMAVPQRDWSLGEGQKFFRPDEFRSRRYWQSTGIDVLTEGRAKMRANIASATFAAAVRAATSNDVNNNVVYATSASNLYSIDSAGSISDKGAHGLGATPSMYGICNDGQKVYLSTTSSGTVGVRSWDSILPTYATFSASGSDSLAYVNNTLFGYRNVQAGPVGGDLVRYSTAGALTVVHTWSTPDGLEITGNVRLTPYGGKLLILRGRPFPELWVYDGTGVSMLHQFPQDLILQDLCVSYGVAFLSGYFYDSQKPVVVWYKDGNTDVLWEADATSTSPPALVPYASGLLFTDDSRGALMLYNIRTGGVHTIGTYTVAGSDPVLAAGRGLVLHTRNQAASYYFAASNAKPSSTTITTSLFDFDSSLDKHFRAVKIEYDEGSDGDGGSVDVAYRLDDLDGAYTTVFAGVTSGTEYGINANGRAVSIKVTLNKGTSTHGPVLKRIYVRAAPVQFQFKRRTYALALTGRDGEGMVTLRDQTKHQKDGLEMAQDLNAAATTTTPIPIGDRFGSFNGIIEMDGFQLVEVRPDEFIAQVRVREV